MRPIGAGGGEGGDGGETRGAPTASDIAARYSSLAPSPVLSDSAGAVARICSA